MTRFSNKYLILTIIIFLAIFTRYLYSKYIPEMSLQGDTFGYYWVSQRIFSNEFQKYFLNERRLPVYPIFLQLGMLLSGNYKAVIGSMRFFQGAQMVFIMQSIAGVGSILLFYLLGTFLRFRPRHVLFLTFLMSQNIFIFMWERILLTESLAIFWLLAITYILLKACRNPRGIHFVLLFLFFILGFLLKPIYIAFPLLVLPFVCLLHPNKKTLAFSITTVILFFTCVFSLYWHNYKTFNYKGINRIVDVNFLGKILEFNLPVEAGKENGPFAGLVNQYRTVDSFYNPFRFLERYGYDLDQSTFPYRELQQFNINIIRANLGQYLVKGSMQLPAALIDTKIDYLIITIGSNTYLNAYFDAVFQFFSFMQIFLLTVFIAYPISLFQAIKRQTLSSVSLCLLGTIALYQISFSVFFSYGEYLRLVSPALPILYLFCFYWWKIILDKIIKIIAGII